MKHVHLRVLQGTSIPTCQLRATTGCQIAVCHGSTGSCSSKNTRCRRRRVLKFPKYHNAMPHWPSVDTSVAFAAAAERLVPLSYARFETLQDFDAQHRLGLASPIILSVALLSFFPLRTYRLSPLSLLSAAEHTHTARFIPA